MDAYTRPGHRPSLQPLTGTVESILDRIFTPIRPYLGFVGRFLIVATFIEDSLRIAIQWDEQVDFLAHIRSMGEWGAMVFLSLNVIAMTVCSVLAIVRKFTSSASLGLLTVVIVQAFGYGFFFDWRFILRTLSVIGGLAMLVTESMSQKKKNLFPGLPELKVRDRSVWFSLFGRILLILLVFTLVTGGQLTVLRVVMGVLCGAASLMVVVGFKARWSAVFLTVVLSVANVLLNGWWDLHQDHPERDYRRYNFFQTLSVLGGFVLLASLGPGSISVDEKKKGY